ncbi:MAG: Gfo/Idh/MocA family oxidoreductase [Lentisphaeria bacterium]|nr:Gfo/Idh/MocA family oxidoreductase [Lentisphaeria bacterium]
MKLKVAVVGIGGFGAGYVHSLLAESESHNVSFVGVIDPFAEQSTAYESVLSAKVPIYENLATFYAEDSADLVCISSPINFHKEQSVIAMRNGSNVLCEKPIAATVAEAEEMLSVQNESGKFCAIGFQHSYFEVTQVLKKRLLSGEFGKIKSARALVEWPRTLSYYQRAAWAGRKTLNGQPVYDSPLNNATAHYLHNLFYLLGGQALNAAKPTSVLAETYRANDIENFDTAYLRVMTDVEVPIHYYCAHPVRLTNGPNAVIEAEKATITTIPSSCNTAYVINFKNGQTEKLEYESDPFSKIWLCCDSIRSNSGPLCDVEAALSHAKTVEAVQASHEITDFPTELVQKCEMDGSYLTYVPILPEVLSTCFASCALPSELGVSWATPGKLIQLA